MDKNLEQLISEFQSRVRDAVALMYRSGVKMPHSSLGWVKTNISVNGVLDGGIEYFKHGAGCEVQLADGKIDFDFGDDGEINGFDLWRLVKFSKRRLPYFGFESVEQVEKSFSDAVAADKFEYSLGGLHYLTGVPRVLAVDIDSTQPGDKLPSRNLDLVWTLFAHYFETADLMRENYEKLKSRLEKAGKLNRNDDVQKRIYFFSWLGFLGVTCEGFRDLNMHRLLKDERPDDFKELLPRADALGKLIKAHWDPLREFRNNVFHLRESPAKIRKFFSKDANRVSWARELHDALEHFFSEYRIQCEVHYAMNNRKGESEIRQAMTAVP